MSKFVISIDAGYDGVKIAAENGTTFWNPSEILSERYSTLPETLDGRVDDDSIILYGQGDERFAVGSLARKLKRGLHGNIDLDDLHIENASRFTNPNFKRLCLSSIVAALKKAEADSGKELINDSLEIYLSVAIPNDYLKIVKDELRKMLTGEHVVKIKLGNNSPEEVKINIAKVGIGSQAILAIIGFGGDDGGYITDFTAEEDFPLLCLDLGYGTCGIAWIENGMYVTKTESNKEYTMMKVNAQTAEKISSITKHPCTHQMIETASRSESIGDSEFRYEHGDEFAKINSLEIQEAEIYKTIEELYAYIKKNYNISFVRNILVSGGTGTRFYPSLSKKFTETKLLESKSVKLADCKFREQKYSPLYAVAVGGLKQMMGAVNKN